MQIAKGPYSLEQWRPPTDRVRERSDQRAHEEITMAEMMIRMGYHRLPKRTLPMRIISIESWRMPGSVRGGARIKTGRIVWQMASDVQDQG